MAGGSKHREDFRRAIVGGLVACGVCIPMKKMMRRTLPL